MHARMTVIHTAHHAITLLATTVVARMILAVRMILVVAAADGIKKNST